MSITISAETLTTSLNWIMDNNKVPVIHGSPGEGKSTIVQSLCDNGGRDTTLTEYSTNKEKLKLITFVCSNHQVEDLLGIPQKTVNDTGVSKAVYIPFDNLPIDTDPLPVGYDGWLLFLDEISAAKPLMQVALQMLILDRKVGSYNLHPKVRIVAAGNRKQDKAHANELSTALKSRLVHLNYMTDADQWIDYGMSKDLDTRILAFINFNKDNIRNFNPDSDDLTFACPRTWENLSSLIKPYTSLKDLNGIYHLIEGTVGETISNSFFVFAKHFLSLPDIKDIINDPENTVIPNTKQTEFAAIHLCINNTNATNINQILKYVNRFGTEFKTIYGRNVNKKDNTLIVKSPDFAKFAVNVLVD